MTAEVADGWMPILFDPAKANDVWGDDLAAGAAKRVRRPRHRCRSPPAAWWPSATT